MKKGSCVVSDALDSLCSITSELTSQGPQAGGGEKEKAKHLYDAVQDRNWSSITLTKCYLLEKPWSFRQFFHAPDSVWLQ